jgi:divalent metal cation (Fe/Co/Zn/Cd) transporter
LCTAARHHAAVHNISVHDSGGELLVDLHLEVAADLSLQAAHDITRRIERALRSENPDIVRVNTHIESRETSAGNGLDVTSQEIDLLKEIQQTTGQILLSLMAGQVAGPGGATSCHDIRITRQQDDRLAVSLHCTFAPDSPVMSVHDASTRIELGLLETLPRLARVLVHAEPAPPSKQI